MSRNDVAKEMKKMAKVAPLCCHDGNVSTRVPCVMCAVTFLFADLLWRFNHLAAYMPDISCML